MGGGNRTVRMALALVAIGAAVWQNLSTDLVSNVSPSRRTSVPREPAPQASAPGLPRNTEPPLRGFDVAILGGRVMDPETGFDKVVNVGVKDGKVTAITERRLEGAKTIDARGLVVAPGFIDILSYEPNNYGIWYKVADGVTTTLGMHGLDGSAKAFFSRYEKAGGLPVHYGGAFDAPYWRATLGVGPYKQLTAAQVARLTAIAEREIRDGYIGIDVEPEYAPGQGREEIVALARVAARHDMPIAFHARYSDALEPGTNLDAIAEVIDVAKRTGAAAHVEHINSTGGTFTMAESLAMIAKARAEGLDVTACVYPYDFWSTFLASSRFDPGWQKRFRISYGDLEIPGTGERLTAESFARYRKQNRVAVAYAIPEQDVVTALRSPFVMLGSDSILVSGEGRHPRASGTFARLLGKYVRQDRTLSLMDALAKMTILPAKRVEKGAPAMRAKGRLQVGADADITIFDPATVIDRATVRNPARFSDGIEWVLVLGNITKDPDGVRKDVRAGRPILSAAALGAREAA